MCEVSNIVGTGRGTYELRVQGIYVWSMSCNYIAHTHVHILLKCVLLLKTWDP